MSLPIRQLAPFLQGSATSPTGNCCVPIPAPWLAAAEQKPSNLLSSVPSSRKGGQRHVAPEPGHWEVMGGGGGRAGMLVL